MVPVSAFFSRLLPQVVGCPEPLAQQALVDAAIHFCDATQAVVVNLDPVAAKAGQAQYELDVPSQSRLSQVHRVWFDDRQLGAVPLSEVNVIESVTGTPTYFYCTDVDEVLTLNLYPTPEKSGTINLRVGLKPARTATSLHASLLERWSDYIVDGALSRLMAMPEQPFTNETRALMLESKLRHGLYVARVDAMRQRAVASLTAKARPFA